MIFVSDISFALHSYSELKWCRTLTAGCVAVTYAVVACREPTLPAGLLGLAAVNLNTATLGQTSVDFHGTGRGTVSINVPLINLQALLLAYTLGKGCLHVKCLHGRRCGWGG